MPRKAHKLNKTVANGIQGDWKGVTGVSNGHSGTPWNDLLQFPIEGRQTKPRQTGLTMVIDKGVGTGAMDDILRTAGDYIDFWKLGFGTTALYRQDVLRQKISIARSQKIDIYPGGTFLEIAIAQNKLENYLDLARETGFTAVEISDGSLTVKKSVRKRAISLGCSLGLKVLTEVGKKDPRERLSTNQLIDAVYHDLESGAFKVILEGRESGTGSGLYDEDGFFVGQVVKDLEEAVGDIDNLIWEAPLKHQQTDLILRFGPNVNMGNIAPTEVFSTESLRLGLRGDTLTVAYFGEF